MANRGEVIVLLLSTVMAAFVLRTMIKAGFFNNRVLNHSPGICRTFDVDGTEDVEILPNGLAFFTSGLRYMVGLKLDPRIASRKGRIYMYDMNHNDSVPYELPLIYFNRTGFNPHGISLNTDTRTGVVSVFVVNHGPDAQAIEIFDFDPKSKSLVFRRSVVDELIHSPNDLVAVCRDSFYVTNDRYVRFDQRILRFLEALVLNTWIRSGVVFYDGTTSRARHVVEGLKSPNGIITSRDGRFVFVVEGFAEVLHIYRRSEDNSLTLAQTIHDAGRNMDNLNIDHKTGTLWGCSFPRPIDFAFYTEDIDRDCPSQVYSVQLGEEHAQGPPFPAYDIREVYANNGSEIKGSTSAAVYDGKFAVSAIFDKFMVCELGPY